MNPSSAYWIERLKLVRHPEGGFYREIFRSDQSVLRHADDEPRSAITSIYYLLEGNDFSAFHRIQSDELWYFHSGDALLIHSFDQSGQLATHELSSHESGSLFLAVGRGTWFAAEMKLSKGYALVSCAVAPGFEFDEFELAESVMLERIFPDNIDLVRRLTRR